MGQKNTVFIFGASGHAKVVIDILERQQSSLIGGIFDDNPDLIGKKVLGYPVLGGLEAIGHVHGKFLIAIGDNTIRARLADQLRRRQIEFGQAIHPSAVISRAVTLGQGTVIMAGAVINADAHLGEHVIVNTSASVDHDCVIGHAVHIAPGAHLCGTVTIGDRTLVGAGATIIPNLHIGNDVIIAAGATVVTPIPDGVTVIGTPGRILERSS